MAAERCVASEAPPVPLSHGTRSHGRFSITTHERKSDERDERLASPPDRRRFLTILSLALGGFSATLVAVPVLGALIGPMPPGAPRPIWRSAGKAGRFAVGETVEVVYTNAGALPWGGVTERTGAWLRRDNEGAQLFMCPCHSGIYDADGSVAAGPPPRPLQTYPVRVRGVKRRP
jgi:menaquinol-cytochrome c reductase iron-sulfur subunit